MADISIWHAPYFGNWIAECLTCDTLTAAPTWPAAMDVAREHLTTRPHKGVRRG